MILNIEDFNPRGEYSPHQQDLLNERKSQLEIDFLDLTPFSDPDFLTKFEQKIPKQEQINYVINTNNYKVKNGYKKSLNYDPHYVLVTRRAIHTQAKKPEQYWTDEHRVARFGLNQEIPKWPHRYYSVIIITTLQALIDHGIEDYGGGFSDGEIKINGKNFDKGKILFIYKPKGELEDLKFYTKGGWMKKTELLEILKKQHKEQYGY